MAPTVAINKFFFWSEAFFAWLLNRIPVHHKWGQKICHGPNCPFRAPQSMTFSALSAGFKNIFSPPKLKNHFLPSIGSLDAINGVKKICMTLSALLGSFKLWLFLFHFCENSEEIRGANMHRGQQITLWRRKKQRWYTHV